ncbi:3-deoxy-7-phosphoheptulonate synthase [Streptomyces anulatus]|uniref:3-deoxy-7-phosphoheptulonate synthase n=1 Tax=Streptomyces anulatus TaxID=1892 RepID=UPI0038679698|nr:3-deoxy-7-phosphoheptulonate synthase [Streptomyces anulatus]
MTQSSPRGLHTTRDPEIDHVMRLPAEQQPKWHDPARAAAVRAALEAEPAQVAVGEVRELTALLARVAAGELCVLQAGDCAEDPADATPAAVALKAEMLDVLGGIMRVGADRPVLRVGRLAGQFAKPRSQPYEAVDGGRLPVFRGPIVNGPEATRSARRVDPDRMLACHTAAGRTRSALEELGRGPGADPLKRVWTSHEALLLDYEVPLVRPTGTGGHYLTSTHWPWIGERTRQPAGAHVRLLARLENPVACKVGPDTTASQVRELCALLDPHRVPGRLTLIPRFGTARIGRLQPLVEEVGRAGHPVLWMCDPMHGNTVKDACGLKIRRLEDIMTEVRGFLSAVRRGGGVCAGVHLEASPQNIAECAGAGTVPVRGPGYRTLCDPRLNMRQAVAVAAHWQQGLSPARPAVRAANP